MAFHLGKNVVICPDGGKDLAYKLAQLSPDLRVSPASYDACCDLVIGEAVSRVFCATTVSLLPR